MEDILQELIEDNEQLFTELDIDMQNYSKLMDILSNSTSSAQIKRNIKKEKIKNPEKIIITLGFLGAKNLLITSINSLIDNEKIDIGKIVTSQLKDSKINYLNLFLNFHTASLEAKKEDKLILFLLSVHSLDSACFCTKTALIEFINQICIQNKIAIDQIYRSYFHVISYLSLEEKNNIDPSLIH